MNIIGTKHENTKGLLFTVIGEKKGETDGRRKYLIQYEDTGTTLYIDYANLKTGKTKDPYAVSMYGVGCVGIFDKGKYPYWKQAKCLHHNMMKRCYSPSDKRGYYGRCFVEKRWLCFANFLEDLHKLPNFDKWLAKEKYELDKDFIVKNNNVYGKDVCSFIAASENRANTSKTRHKYFY